MSKDSSFMGGKRIKFDKNFKPKKCAKKRKFVGGDADDDRISQLPDDILVGILSLLSLKEAGRTSVLSSRWINLWKRTPSLDFDAQTPLHAQLGENPDRRRFKDERLKYVQWVNSVLQSHKSPTLKHFRLCFSLDKSDRNSITRWLQFALSRQLQRLELNFPICDNIPKYYRFPEELFLLPPHSDCFKSLKALSFKSVSVSSGAIEFLLHNCSLLEQLIVDDPGKISKLEVCGPSLVLKHLEIGYCPTLELLKVSASSLTSLKLTSCLKGVFLENVPMLVAVSVICYDTSINRKGLLSVLSCCISQLETLTLSLIKARQKPDELCEFPEMPKLKKLVIEYKSCGDESLIRPASLTKASPYLQEFVLKNKWSESLMGCKSVDAAAASMPFPHMGSKVVDAAAAIMPFPHEHLEVFKFCGYRGLPSDDALVRYILESCVVLEKIIIDPSGTYPRDRLDVEETARAIAKQHFEPQLLPPHVEVVVL